MKKNKNIKTIFLIATTIMAVELIFAGLLFTVKKINQKKVNNSNISNNNYLKPISKIEKEAILKKNSQTLKIENDKTNIDPRDRALPKSMLPTNAKSDNNNLKNTVDPRQRALPKAIDYNNSPS